jgi:hypothetical protein
MPMDFIFCGVLWMIIFTVNSVHGIATSLAMISTEIRSVTKGVLTCTQTDWTFGLDVIWIIRGSHVEVK